MSRNNKNIYKERKTSTHRHVTSNDVESTWSSELAAKFNVVHILKENETKQYETNEFIKKRSEAALTPSRAGRYWEIWVTKQYLVITELVLQI